ncbi:MAG: T9SS type A sorting domain-containing protein [Candidatus Kapabacteria bacterium]|nr:T9SS type A sorting domain-containing protein [Ignavibacteriota bacterium]MCW5886138.1 T9SS type A sorting domain-containing protein [Candidatus Kapabacteria bacterium]
MMRVISLVVVVILLSAFSITAQIFGGRMHDEELKLKLQEYHKINVCPQWFEWQKKIESSMSDEDLQKLHALRAEAQKVISEKKECLDNCRKESGNNTDKAGRPRKGNKMKGQGNDCANKCGLKDSKEYFAAQLKSLLKNYDNIINSILEDSKPYHEKWQSERKEIIENHFVNSNESARPGKGKRGNGMKGRSDEPKNKQFIGMLLMWNGSCDSNPEDLFEFGTNSAPKKSNIKVNAYPNPFTDNTNLSFILENASDVKLIVSTSTGEEVAQLHDGKLNAGEHSFNFNARNLTPGAYIYKLDINGKILSGKVILTK